VAQRLDVAVVPLTEGVAADPVEVAAQRAGQVEPGLVLRVGLEILGRISVARAIDREGGAGQQAGQHTGGQSWNGLHGTSSLTLWRRQRPARRRRPLSGAAAARCRKPPCPAPGGRITLRGRPDRASSSLPIPDGLRIAVSRASPFGQTARTRKTWPAARDGRFSKQTFTAMSEDDSSSASETPEKRRGWLERLSSAISGEPSTRED